MRNDIYPHPSLHETFHEIITHKYRMKNHEKPVLEYERLEKRIVIR